MLLIPLGACFARNPIYAPAELASVERGSSPENDPIRHLATIAALLALSSTLFRKISATFLRTAKCHFSKHF